MSFNGIDKGVEQYNDIIAKQVQIKEEINILKGKIDDLECQNLGLESNKKQKFAELQAEIYRIYKQKDLLKMISRVEKMSNKEIASDFREIVTKFEKHQLNITDITALQSYVNIYQKDNGLIKTIFKALGGRLDE